MEVEMPIRIRYYASTVTKEAPVERPSGLFREIIDEREYRTEYYSRSHEWVLDSDLARYTLRGEIGATAITARVACAIIQHWGGEPDASTRMGLPDWSGAQSPLHF